MEGFGSALCSPCVSCQPRGVFWADDVSLGSGSGSGSACQDVSLHGLQEETLEKSVCFVLATRGHVGLAGSSCCPRAVCFGGKRFPQGKRFGDVRPTLGRTGWLLWHAPPTGLGGRFGARTRGRVGFGSCRRSQCFWHRLAAFSPRIPGGPHLSCPRSTCVPSLPLARALEVLLLLVSPTCGTRDGQEQTWREAADPSLREGTTFPSWLGLLIGSRGRLGAPGKGGKRKPSHPCRVLPTKTHVSPREASASVRGAGKPSLQEFFSTSMAGDNPWHQSTTQQELRGCWHGGPRAARASTLTLGAQ